MKIAVRTMTLTLLVRDPNLNGFWAIGRGPDTPVGSGFGERDPNIKRGEARNAAAQSSMRRTGPQP